MLSLNLPTCYPTLKAANPDWRIYLEERVLTLEETVSAQQDAIAGLQETVAGLQGVCQPRKKVAVEGNGSGDDDEEEPEKVECGEFKKLSSVEATDEAIENFLMDAMKVTEFLLGVSFSCL